MVDGAIPIMLIVFGSLVTMVVAPIALIVWAATIKPRAQARQREVDQLKEQVALLQADVETLKDQVADLVIEAHDGALLRPEEERRTVRRLRSD